MNSAPPSNDCPCGGMVLTNGHGKGVCRECGAETWPDDRPHSYEYTRDVLRAVATIEAASMQMTYDNGKRLNALRGGMKL